MSRTLLHYSQLCYSFHVPFFVRTAVVGKASCGDVIKLQVKIENDVIQDVRFKVSVGEILTKCVW